MKNITLTILVVLMTLAGTTSKINLTVKKVEQLNEVTITK